MVTTTIPYGGIGVPLNEVSDDFAQIELYAGVASSFFDDYPTAATTDLAAFSVVGLNATGDLALALNDKTVQAIGVLMTPVSPTAGVAGTAAVALDGCFNPAALVWDATYDDDAKKAAAFRGAPSPTQITTQKTVG